MAWTWFHRFGSPPYFYALARRLAPWFGWTALVAIAIGLYGGLVVAPSDALQGDVFRIIYIHVPGAWLALMTYMAMAIAAAVGLIWRIKVAHAAAAACAPAGATFTAVSLATGMIWGAPTWGTFWAWDPRIIFQALVLLFFLGCLALRSAIDDQTRADRATAVLAIVGSVNVPIVHYSVVWWNSLHQPASIMKVGKPTIHFSMLWPLLVMAIGFTLYFFYILLVRSRAELLRRERGTWLREELGLEEAR